MQKYQSEKALKIAQIKDDFTIKFPHAVKCKIDVQQGTAKIGRIQVELKSERYFIPAGWRAKISLLCGIDRRITVTDTENMPSIMPRVLCPIGPFEAKVPKDILKSEDDWNLELYLIDPFNNEECIFKSASVAFVKPIKTSETPPSPRIRQIPKDRRLKTAQIQLICRIGEKVRRNLIYAKSTIAFGRALTNDLVLQLFPAGAKNDSATRRISGQHGHLERKDGVWRLIDHSTNGTRINGRYFRNTCRTVQDSDQIRIADVLELEFTCTANHAKLRRLNNLADQETYLFAIEAITIGRDLSNAIVLEDADDFHAMIIHNDGEFWIKGVGSGAKTIVDGERLRPNELCPIIKGMEIRIGEATIRV